MFCCPTELSLVQYFHTVSECHSPVLCQALCLILKCNGALRFSRFVGNIMLQIFKSQQGTLIEAANKSQYFFLNSLLISVIDKFYHPRTWWQLFLLLQIILIPYLLKNYGKEMKQWHIPLLFFHKLQLLSMHLLPYGSCKGYSSFRVSIGVICLTYMVDNTLQKMRKHRIQKTRLISAFTCTILFTVLYDVWDNNF